VAGLIDTPKGRAGRRRRAFTLAQAVVLIVAARSRPVLELHGGLKDPRRPASLMHADSVVSLMAGVRPEVARAIGWERDVNHSRKCSLRTSSKRWPGMNRATR
jgi:hypothetical protein